MKQTDQNICVKCGLCCDGTLFHQAILKDHELIDPEFSFNIELSENKSRTFKLPCCYLKDKACTVFEKRPYSICGAFNCELLVSLRQGEIDFDGAIKIIEETIFLKEKIERNLRNHFPQFIENSFNEKLVAFEKLYSSHPDPIEFRKKYGYLLLDILMLNRRLTDSFYDEEK